MPETQLSCPNCSEPVGVGDVICPNCGVNLKSGESYEARIKKATGKLSHSEEMATGLFVGAMVVIALALFGGYLMQRRAVKVMRKKPDMFVPTIRWMQRLQDEMAAGNEERAKELARGLIDNIAGRIREIESDIKIRQELKGLPEPKYSEEAALGLLNSLKLKARRAANLKAEET